MGTKHIVAMTLLPIYCPKYTAALEPQNKSECHAAGGEWIGPLGLASFFMCEYQMKDGGKDCSDASECESDRCNGKEMLPSVFEKYKKCAQKTLESEACKSWPPNTPACEYIKICEKGVGWPPSPPGECARTNNAVDCVRPVIRGVVHQMECTE